MKVVRTSVLVAAPAELVFDLARDVRVHTRGQAHTHERAEPPGRTRGLLVAGDLFALRSRHFGLTWHYRARVVVCEPPDRLVDVQERGPWRSMRHEQRFVQTGAGTLVTEELCWRSPAGPLGSVLDDLLLRRYLRGLLLIRAAHLRMVAEQIVTDSAGSAEAVPPFVVPAPDRSVAPARVVGPAGAAGQGESADP